MKRTICLIAAVALCACLLPVCLPGQAPAAKPAAAPALPGVRGEFLTALGTDESKYARLGEKMPQEKWIWRPGEGVRSLAEVYLHVTSSNFGYARIMGVAPPEGLDLRNIEKLTTDKANILDLLKQSFASVRQGVEKLPAEGTIRLYGSERSYGGAFLIITEHLGEHLGQSIAYARVNGVVPPWSETPAPAAKK
jgi:uncharacterized damage-inducible protein DinB